MKMYHNSFSLLTILIKQNANNIPNKKTSLSFGGMLNLPVIKQRVRYINKCKFATNINFKQKRVYPLYTENW